VLLLHLLSLCVLLFTEIWRMLRPILKALPSLSSDSSLTTMSVMEVLKNCCIENVSDMEVVQESDLYGTALKPIQIRKTSAISKVTAVRSSPVIECLRHPVNVWTLNNCTSLSVCVLQQSSNYWSSWYVHCSVCSSIIFLIISISFYIM